MAELIRRYESDVHIVARARVSSALRPHLDSIDLMQSLHRSVFVGLRNKKFDIETPEQLMGLALTIVKRKAARHWRKLSKQQRLSGAHANDLTTARRLVQVTAEDDDPARMAEIEDVVDQLLAGLNSRDQQLLRLRLEGYSTIEAARELRLDPDVTRARLSRIRRKLERARVAQGLV